MLLEVIEFFPGEYIHIGGDEAPKDRWRKCGKCQERIRAEGLEDEEELQKWFIERIGRFLAEHYRKIIGWDEIIEGGIPRDATVMSWRGTEGGIEAAMAGHDAIMTPRSYTYINLRYSDSDRPESSWHGSLPFPRVYEFEPVPENLPAETAEHIIGVQGCLWGEFIPDPERLQYLAFPRALAVAETAWSLPERKDWKNFLDRVDTHTGRLDVMGANYHHGPWPSE